MEEDEDSLFYFLAELINVIFVLFSSLFLVLNFIFLNLVNLNLIDKWEIIKLNWLDKNFYYLFLNLLFYPLFLATFYKIKKAYFFETVYVFCFSKNKEIINNNSDLIKKWKTLEVFVYLPILSLLFFYINLGQDWWAINKKNVIDYFLMAVAVINLITIIIGYKLYWQRNLNEYQKFLIADNNYFYELLDSWLIFKIACKNKRENLLENFAYYFKKNQQKANKILEAFFPDYYLAVQNKVAQIKKPEKTNKFKI